MSSNRSIELSLAAGGVLRDDRDLLVSSAEPAAFAVGQIDASSLSPGSLLPAASMQDHQPSLATTAAIRDVVFIDSRVPDLQDLLNGLKPGEKAFVIDGGSDGLAQITAILKSEHLSGLDGIQIVAHGGQGELELGGSTLNGADLSSYAHMLAQIGGALAGGGDLSLYACDVAQGTAGQQFVSDLSAYAGVDVSAATHNVGSADLFGSWNLDFNTGNAEANVPFTSTALNEFDGVLTTGVFQVPSETFGNETVGADIGFPAVAGNGDYVEGWQHGDSPFNQAVDVFDQNGNRIGSEISESLPNGFGEDSYQAAAAGSNPNDFWVVSALEQFSGSFNFTEVIAREYQISSNSVSKIATQTLINTTASGNDSENLSVVQLANGDYVLAWAASNPNLTSGTTDVQVFDSNFNALTSATVVSTASNDEATTENIHVTADGSNVDVTYNPNEGGITDIWGVSFDVGSDGSISGLSSPKNLTAALPGGSQGWGQTELSNGNILVLYSSAQGSAAHDGALYGEVYSPGFSGSPTPFLIADSVADTPQYDEVLNGAATNFISGYYIVTYSRVTNGGTEQDIYARIYAPNNTALTNEFLVDTPQANVRNEGPYVVATNGAGGVALTWTSLNYAAFQYPPAQLEARIYSDVGPISNGVGSHVIDIFDNTTGVGSTVSSLIAGGQYLSILGHAFGGLAITGNAATSGQGVWQYSSNGGTSWNTISTGVSTTNATIIGASDLVRFEPASGFSGAPGSLTVLVWDGQDGFAADSTGQDISQSIFDTSDTSQTTASFTGAFAGTSIALGTNIIGLDESQTGSVIEGATLNRSTAGTGVLGDATNLDGHTLSVSAFAGSAGNVGHAVVGTYGSLTLNANGTYSYVATNTSAIDAAAFGSHPTDTFTYTVSDEQGVTAPATLTITLDRAPTVVADVPSGEALESGSAVTGNVLTNDTDHDGDSIVVSAVNGSGGGVGTSVAGTYGHITIQANGSYSYVANISSAIDAAATGSHPTDTFTYTASDPSLATSTTTITITLDRAPTVVADVGAVVGSAMLNVLAAGGVLANDSDRDGDTLVVSAVNGNTGAVGNTVNGIYGTMTISADGSYIYNANNTSAIDAAPAGLHPTDTFTYTASDGHGGTTTSTITITLDRAPTVVADAPATQALESGSAVTGNVLTNDSDRDGDTLTVFQVNGVHGNVGASVAGTYGDITIQANGSYSYSADNTAAIDGAATGSHLTDTFSYQASDGLGGVSTTTVSFTLDRAPTVVADAPATQAVESGSAVTGNVLTNDSDRDGDTLTVFQVNGVHGNVGASVSGTYGDITIQANGSYSYSADNTAAIDGAATGSHLTDTFSYQASDGLGGFTTTTITITLDRAPTVVADAPATQAVESGSAVTGNVLANDSDRDGDTLTVFQVNGVHGNVGASVSGTYGDITINADGSYSYSADNTAAIDGAPTGSHLTDTFSYQASDGFGGFTTTTITITLDRAPTVVNAGADVAEGGSADANAAGGVLAGDSDRDGDTLAVTSIGGSSIAVGQSIATTYGHITLNADGSYDYVADGTTAIDGAPTGSHPLDVVSFLVGDGFGGETMQTLSFTIDRAATATADSIATTENTPAQNGVGGNANLLANDVDKDGDAITIVAVNGSAANVGNQITTADGALVTVNADGSYTYDPNHQFDYLADPTSGASDTTATDSFTYTVDGGSTVTVTITVTGVDSNDVLIGTSGADTIHGGTGDDVFFDDDGQKSATNPHDTSAGHSGGADALSGDDGDDVFYMGANLSAAVQIDGGTGIDHVVLNGDYSAGVVFNATTMVNVEFLGLTAGHSYNLTMAAATVALGQTLTVQAGTLGTGDSLTFDGSADTAGGDFVITGGAGNDVLTGGYAKDTFNVGAGNDTVHGGGGNDHIVLGANLSAADSIDGGSGTDTLYLNGDYSAGVVFAAATLTNVEDISLAAGHDYNLTMNNATVAAGQTLTLHATALGAGDGVVFDASADLTGGNYVLESGAGDDVLTGGAGNDTFRPGTGNDTVHGGAGNDTINMGAALTAADSIDGGAGTDTLVLNGDYSAGVTFAAATLTNVEDIVLAAGHDYSLTMNAATVAAGDVLTLKASTLGAGDSLTFDGSADTAGGSFVLYGGNGTDTLSGGAGNDVIHGGNATNTLTGGAGADTIYGGTGTDQFVYAAVSDSTSTAFDKVHGFDADADTFKLTGDTVNAIDTAVTAGHLSAATFDANLAAAIGASQLAPHDAVLFTPDSGGLHGQTFLIVDVNGIAGYQAGQDFVIDITGAANLQNLATTDFVG